MSSAQSKEESSFTGLEELSRMKGPTCPRNKRKGPPACYKPRRKLEETLPCDGTMKFTVIRQVKESFETLNQLRKDHMLCDVTLISGGVRFPCHRVVLASASPYFHGMFTGGMIECCTKEINLVDISADLLSDILDFIYSAEITVTENTVCRLMPAAVMLQMPHLTEACTTFMEHQLDASNCIGIGKFALGYGCLDLQKRANRFLLKHFSDVRLEEEFIRLSFEELVKIISSDQLIVKCESEVYSAVMTWVAHDFESRGCKLPCLLQNVRLGQIPPDFIKQQLLYCDVLRKAPTQCMEKLNDLFQKLAMHNHSIMDPPRETCEKLAVYCIGGYLRHSVSNVDCYNPLNNEWKRVSDMPHPRSGLAVCTIQGLVYAIGGRNNSHEGNIDLNIVDCYDPRSNTWSPLPPMMTPRNRVATAVLDNHLYAAGGSHRAEAFNSVECYDPATRQWKAVAGMSTPRISAGAAVVNRFLYVIGGFTGTERLNTVEKFYPERNEWQMCPPMSIPRSGAGVCALDSYIFVAGGYDSTSQLNSVERFDTRTNVWETVAPMRHARSALSMVAMHGKLYVLGGYGGNEFMSVVECYHPDRNEWIEVSRMPSGRSGQGVTVGPAPSF